MTIEALARGQHPKPEHEPKHRGTQSSERALADWKGRHFHTCTGRHCAAHSTAGGAR